MIQQEVLSSIAVDDFEKAGIRTIKQAKNLGRISLAESRDMKDTFPAMVTAGRVAGMYHFYRHGLHQARFTRAGVLRFGIALKDYFEYAKADFKFDEYDAAAYSWLQKMQPKPTAKFVNNYLKIDSASMKYEAITRRRAQWIELKEVYEQYPALYGFGNQIADHAHIVRRHNRQEADMLGHGALLGALAISQAIKEDWLERPWVLRPQESSSEGDIAED